VSEQVRGRVKFFHRLKGFGVIVGTDSQDYFFSWKDIDIRNGFIYIRSKDGFKPKGIDKKTGKAKERLIPIHEGVKDVIKKVVDIY